jgi:hypothetical protein
MWPNGDFLLHWLILQNKCCAFAFNYFNRQQKSSPACLIMSFNWHMGIRFLNQSKTTACLVMAKKWWTF